MISNASNKHTILGEQRGSHTQARPNTTRRTKHTRRTWMGVASTHANSGRTKRATRSKGPMSVVYREYESVRKSSLLARAWRRSSRTVTGVQVSWLSQSGVIGERTKKCTSTRVRKGPRWPSWWENKINERTDRQTDSWQ